MRAVNFLQKIPLVGILILFTVPNSQSADPSAAPHLCSLLTASEIHEVVGITVGSGTEDTMDTLYQCSWAGEEENALSPMISFEKAGSNVKTACNQRFDFDKKKGRFKEEVSDLGKKAWWSYYSNTPSTFIGAVTVCDSHGILRVSLWGPGEEMKTKTMAQALAKIAYGRLTATFAKP